MQAVLDTVLSPCQTLTDKLEQAFVDQSSKDVVLELKAKSLTNLYFFAKVVLGNKQLTANLHLPLCTKLQDPKKRKLYEWPRGHFKTTIASKSLPIWRAIPFEPEVEDYLRKVYKFDDESCELLRRLHNPNIRILVVSGTDDNAKKILRSTRTQFETNMLLKGLWPQIAPSTSSKWTDNELCLTRTEHYSESTFEALGVGGALQSRHFDIIIEDDLVGKEATESESVMKKIIDYHILIEGAFDDPETSENIVIGNRWAYNDLNSWIMENEAEFYEFYSRAAIEEDKPIFPERFSLESLARIKKKQGIYVFSCQYLNDPLAPGAHDFETEWLQEYKYEQVPGDEVVWLTRADGKKTTLGQLNRYLLIDPAREGVKGKARHGIIAVGVDAEENLWILRAWAEKCSTDRMLGKAFEFYAQYKCIKAGIEGFGGDIHLKNYMDYIARTENKRMNLIVFRKDATKSKEERIRSMQPFFERRKVAVPSGDVDFTKEYTEFPSGQTVDLLDALAHGPEIWRRPLDGKILAKIKTVYAAMDASRSQITGY